MTTLIMSDGDAFRSIDSLCSQPSSVGNLQFDGWPILAITFEPGNGSITPKIRRFFCQVDDALQRSYAQMKYGSPDKRRLTEREKYQLQIPWKVTSGSTRLLGDFSGAMTAFAKTVAGKLTPRQACLVSLLLGLSIVGAAPLSIAIYKNAEVRTAELAISHERLHLEHDERHLKIQHDLIQLVRDTSTAAARTLQTDPEVGPIMSAFDYVPWRSGMLDLTPKAGVIRVNGIELPKTVARVVAEESRKASRKVRQQAKAPLPLLLDGWETTLSRDTVFPPPMRLGVKQIDG